MKSIAIRVRRLFKSTQAAQVGNAMRKYSLKRSHWPAKWLYTRMPTITANEINTTLDKLKISKYHFDNNNCWN